jgi:phage baseplate assembly protein V
VEIDGSPLPLGAAAALASVRVQQGLSLPSLCEVELVDPPAELDARWIRPGASLRVQVADAEPALFDGDVTAVELCYGPSRARAMRIRGYDFLHRLRKRQPVRAHVQVTVADLVRELTGDLGLPVEAVADGPMWPWIVQWRQSDLELLADLAARCGLHLAVRDRVLHLFTLEGIGEPLALVAGENLLEVAVEVNAESACRTVDAAGWDVHRVEAQRGRATQARLGRRVDASVSPQDVGGTGRRMLADQPAPTGSHLEAAAQAELDRCAAREVVLRGVAEGDPRLVPGARVQLGGVAPTIAGSYVLASANHLVDATRGYVTQLSTEPPPGPPRAPAAGAAVGEVSQVDGASGRVKVALTSFGEVETDWMQVLSPGAGPKKGLAAFPDVGDRVLVLFTGGDPAQGVVLGGLYGAEGPTDPGIEGGAVRRFTLRTAAGHVLRLDDEKRTLRIEDAAGSFVEMAPDGMRLRSQVPLTIEAPGQPVIIRGSSVDFKRG